MRIGNGLLQTGNDGATDIVPLEGFHPYFGGALRDDVSDRACRFTGIGLGIALRWRKLDQLAEIMPEAILDRRGGKVATIRRAVDLIAWTAASHQRVTAARPLPGNETVSKPPIG